MSKVRKGCFTHARNDAISARMVGVPVAYKDAVMTTTDEMIDKRHPNGKTYRQRRHMGYARYTMQKLLGRKLARWEVVWHRDGDLFNNAIANLELISASELGRRCVAKQKAARTAQDRAEGSLRPLGFQLREWRRMASEGHRTEVRVAMAEHMRRNGVPSADKIRDTLAGCGENGDPSLRHRTTVKMLETLQEIDALTARMFTRILFGRRRRCSWLAREDGRKGRGDGK